MRVHNTVQVLKHGGDAGFARTRVAVSASVDPQEVSTHASARDATCPGVDPLGGSAVSTHAASSDATATLTGGSRYGALFQR